MIGAITLLLASGLANFLLFNDAAQAWEDGTWMKQTKYHALFGVKFLLALGVFYFASGLVGRGEGTAWIRANRGKWLSVTLLMAVAIVMLSGWMRGLHVGPNRVAEEEASGVRFNVTQEGMAAGEDESNSAAPAEEAAGMEPRKRQRTHPLRSQPPRKRLTKLQRPQQPRRPAGAAVSPPCVSGVKGTTCRGE